MVFFSLTASYAMVTDLFEANQQGRAMGLLQVAFALSQVGGLPLALYIVSHFAWQWGYAFIFQTSTVFMLWLGVYLQPLTIHLQKSRKKPSWQHFQNSLLNQGNALEFLEQHLHCFWGCAVYDLP